MDLYPSWDKSLTNLKYALRLKPIFFFLCQEEKNFCLHVFELNVY